MAPRTAATRTAVLELDALAARFGASAWTLEASDDGLAVSVVIDGALTRVGTDTERDLPALIGATNATIDQAIAKASVIDRPALLEGGTRG